MYICASIASISAASNPSIAGSQSWSANGGSIKAISIDADERIDFESLSSHFIASVLTNLPCLAPSNFRLLASTAAVRVHFSSSQTWAAPLDKHSSPNAPVPANRSKQREPAIFGVNQLNSVSRTRSPVGRSPGSSIKWRLRPRHWPPIMRSVEFFGWQFFLGNASVFRIINSEYSSSNSDGRIAALPVINNRSHTKLSR